MNQKKVIIGIIMLIVLIVLGSASYALSSMMFHKEEKVEKKKNETVTVKVDRKLDLCKKEGCANYSTLYFQKVSTNIEDPEVKKLIQEANGKVNSYYDEATSDQMTRPECASMADVYQYGTQIQSGIQAKIHKGILNLTVSAERYDLCTSQPLGQEVDVQLYDLKNQKKLTNEEYLKENGYTEQQVQNMMESLMRKIYTTGEVENIIADAKKENKYVIYYDNSNQLVIQYYIPYTKTWYPLQLNQSTK